MKFSWQWLNKYLKKPISPEKMVELLNMHAFEVESVEKKGDDSVLDIKILPNRAHDCLSFLGIAKELAAISGVGFAVPTVKIKEDKSLKIKDFISVEVPAKDLCRRFSVMAVADIGVGQSPKWMQERLMACGLRPINTIVDITNYVMLETGQPLHAFDADKIGGRKIIVRRAKKDEEIITLDEAKARQILNENILVIADQNKAIGIAGTKGGRGTEIDSQTKNIVVESANFEPTSIRRTSKALNLKTDASTRFENGPDPNLTIPALERCACLISELTSGKIVSGAIDFYPKKVKPWRVILEQAKAESLLGIKLSAEQISKILKRLGLSTRLLKKDKKIFIEAQIPTARLDLVSPEDLIEEVGRLLGYDKIAAESPKGALLAAAKNESLIWEDKIRDILVGLGYNEVYNYSLISKNDEKLFGFKDLIGVKNPLSQEQSFLRPNLIVGLLKNVKENLKYFSHIRLFEIGHVFGRDKDFVEENKIAGIICEKNAAGADNKFFEMKGAIDILIEKLGMSDLWFDDAIPAGMSWLGMVHPQKKAEVKVGENLIGWLGEIKPEILAALATKERPVVFELDLKKIEQLASEERQYLAPSKYPAIIRDLAVLVDWQTKIEQVTNVIENAGGELLADVNLFDIYEREGLTEGKKSLAFRLIYQSDERNLTDEEVNKIQKKIIKAIEEKGWEVRK